MNDEIIIYDPKFLILEKISLDLETKEIYVSKNPQFQTITIETIGSLCIAINENIQQCYSKCSENYKTLIRNLKNLYYIIDKGSIDPSPVFQRSQILQHLLKFLSSILESQQRTKITALIIQSILHIFYEIIFVVRDSSHFFLGTNLSKICSFFVRQDEINSIFIFSLHILFLMNHFGFEYHNEVFKEISYIELTTIFFNHIQADNPIKKIPERHLSSYMNGFGHFFADICQYQHPPEQTQIIISCLLFLLTTNIESSFKYTFLGITRLIRQGNISIEEFSQMDINSDLYQAINSDDPNDVEYGLNLLSLLFTIGWKQISQYNSINMFNLVIKWKKNLRTLESALQALLQAIKVQPLEYSQPLYNINTLISLFDLVKGPYSIKKVSFQVISSLIKRNPINSLQRLSTSKIVETIDIYEILLDPSLFHILVDLLDVEDDEFFSELVTLFISFFHWCQSNPIRIQHLKSIIIDEKDSIESAIESLEESLSESSKSSLLEFKQITSSLCL